MPSFITVAATAVAVLILSYVYAFAKNTFDARNTGFPSIYLPIAQDNIVWMLTSVPLRHFLRANLPARIFNRLNLSIYGWEFHHRFLPYEAFCGSQADLKTFMLVTCGRLELWTSNAEIVAQVLGRPKDFMQLDLSNWIVCYHGLFVLVIWADHDLQMGIFGNNILTSDGDHWARQRKVIATVINERVSKAVFNESVLQAEGLLAELTSRQGDSETIKTNQLFNMAKKVAINVLSGAGMGNQVPWEDKADEQPKAGFRQTYIQSTRAVINCVGGPIILPQWFLKAYPPFLPGKAFLKNLSIAKTEFPVHTKDLLEKERVRSSAEGNSTQNNILSQLLRASEKPAGENPKGGSKAALSEEELVANMFIFTAAGFGKQKLGRRRYGRL